MRRQLVRASIIAVMLCLSAGVFVEAGDTFFGRFAARRAQTHPWYGQYYNGTWGAPVAIVVPPNVEFQTHWGWGVGNTRITTIDHQFSRNWPGPAQGGGVQLSPTPMWPSDTDQFGYYYIRGPW
ncbi:MAG: hypothetical protein ACUVQG_11865 [Thermogutta sp.]